MKKTETRTRNNWAVWTWPRVMVCVEIAVAAVYFWYFCFKAEVFDATSAGAWGQFGDYFGGILNPMMAFAAFYWLTRSVKLQKQEFHAVLSEMRISREQEALKTQLEMLTIFCNETERNINSLRVRVADLRRKQLDLESRWTAEDERIEMQLEVQRQKDEEIFLQAKMLQRELIEKYLPQLQRGSNKSTR